MRRRSDKMVCSETTVAWPMRIFTAEGFFGVVFTAVWFQRLGWPHRESRPNGCLAAEEAKVRGNNAKRDSKKTRSKMAEGELVEEGGESAESPQSWKLSELCHYLRKIRGEFLLHG